jgi:uncharacterized protein
VHGIMILDLSQIRQPETEVFRRYEPSAFEEGSSQFRVVAPVTLRLKVHKDRDRFRVVGNVSTTLELACSRCLEPFTLPVESEFDVRYLPQSENTGEEREVEEDDLSDAFYRDDVIDLRQLMEEQFYLALPMKPLCREDCKGLCPNCGTNWNVASCDCQVRWEDPRLAGLKALMHRDKDNA